MFEVNTQNMYNHMVNNTMMYDNMQNMQYDM